MSVDRSWYLAYTKPRQESVAELNLDRQGFEVYLPMFRTIKRGVAEPVLEPMFPRYLFVRPRTEAQSLGVVRSTRGVLTLIRFGIEFGCVPCAVIERIRAFEAARRDASLAQLSGVRAGQTVMVCDGAFKGLEGIVESVSSKRVVVLLEVLGRLARVGLPHNTLAAA